jgi:hypothetical protein
LAHRDPANPDRNIVERKKAKARKSTEEREADKQTSRKRENPSDATRQAREKERKGIGVESKEEAAGSEHNAVRLNIMQ